MLKVLFKFIILSLCILSQSAFANILISEVGYDPVGSEPNSEWFELFNPTALPIDIQNWTFTDGEGVAVIPNSTIIAPGQYFLLARKTVNFQANYPAVNVDLEYDALIVSSNVYLSNSGDSLSISDNNGNVVDFVSWEGNTAGWDISANQNESIIRKGNLDTGTEADWADHQTPSPGVGAGFSLNKVISLVTEGDTDTFTIVLDVAPATDVVIDLSSSDDAIATASPASVTFTPLDWDTPQDITINTFDDADLFDANATITASVNAALSDDVFATLIEQTVDVSVADDDVAQITIDDVEHDEGDAGNTDYIFTITLDQESPDDVSVDFATIEDIAFAGDDYIELTGQVTIPAGDTSATVTIEVIGEQLVEGDENFQVELTNPVNSAFDNDIGEATILNDDIAEMSIDDIELNENNAGNTSYTFTISINNPSDSDILVDYETVDGSALAGDNDYTAIPTTLATIPAGALSTQITVLVTGDNKVESTETFAVKLIDPDGATLIKDTGVGTILNDDFAKLSIDDVIDSEGDSGNTSYSFTISTDKPSDTPITVNYATADASALAGDNDYTAIATTQATIPVGASSTQITVLVTGDHKVESTETFTVQLTNPSGASIDDGAGLGTINNDDSAKISINDVNHIEGDSGNISYTFTISIDNPSDTTITVDYATADDSATLAGGDYTTLSGQASIAAGETTTNFVVQVAGDLLVESDEMFFVNISNPVGATILDAQGVGTIVENDVAGFSITPTTIGLNEGGSSSVSIVLTAQPINDVVIELSSPDANAVSTNPSIAGLSNVSFNSANWNIPQQITVIAEEDADLNDENVILSALVNPGASDDAFDLLGAQTVTVTVVDDDIDTDGDGIPDEDDPDKDNDGNPDVTDPNPLDAVASNDNADLLEGVASTIDILANDDFIAGANLIIQSIGGSAIGDISFDAQQGTMTYTPAAGELGVVTVEYEVCTLNQGVCAVAAVAMNIAAAPINPAKSIPTLSEWMLMLLSLLLFVVGMRKSKQLGRK